ERQARRHVDGSLRPQDADGVRPYWQAGPAGDHAGQDEAWALSLPQEATFEVPQAAPPQAPVFAIGLEPSDRETLAHAYAQEILRSLQLRRLGTSASKGLEQDLQGYWDRYELAPPTRDLPFEGAANYRVPLTKWVIDSIYGRVFAGLAAVRPYFRVEPTEPGEAE